MSSTIRRNLILVACISLFTTPVFAETIVKLNLGSTGPDIELEDGFLSTVDDGDAANPGDQTSTVTLHGFIGGAVADITPPNQGSFSLSGVATVGSPFIVNQGLFSLVTQQTTGGTFEVFDDNGGLLLSADLMNGSLHGTTGASATGGFLTANLGTFKAGTDAVFSQLAPNTASLAISLTDVSSPTGAGGFSVGTATIDGNEVGFLENFVADATANVGADQFGVGLPEPASVSMALFGLLGMMGFRRRR